MFPISAGVSENSMEEVRNPIGKEVERMKKLYQKLKNMKYRNKLRALLVTASLVPVILIALYSHMRMSSFVRQREMEDMVTLLEQTRENIDSQIAVYTSLMNYLTYAPDIEEIIREKNMDNYTAYEQYMKVADPLLTVPKSYHDAILQIQLFAESIKVEHEYTLVPLEKIQQTWWRENLGEDVRIQWMVNREKKELVALRCIYEKKELTAVLCLTLDYDKIFQPLAGIAENGNGVVATDGKGHILYEDISLMDLGKNNIDQTAFEKEIKKDFVLREVGENYFYAKGTSGKNEWNYYLFRSQKAISAAVKSLFLEEIPLILLCALLVFALGTFFSRIFTKKIEELTQNMDQVNHGSREVTVFSDSEDEVGILVRSFRRMMDEINRLIDQVYVNQIALKEFELKALQAQINPHFLYNTLSAINWMAIRSNQKEISKVTLALSTFYRTALSKGEDMVTVESCIQNIEAYLQIQLVMHDNGFEVQWETDSSIKNEKVPKLLLQPVVENALEHGLDVKEEGDKILKIFILDQGEEFVMAVEDNGPGMEPEKAKSLVTYQAKGYGLKNVNDRIRLLYGEKYGVSIYSCLGEGTRVEIRLPKDKTPEREVAENKL